MGQDNAGELDRTPFAENPHYAIATGIDNNGNIIVQDPETVNLIKYIKQMISYLNLL